MKFDQKHEMIRKLVRQFAETELTPEILDEVEETGVFPKEIQDKMAKCGFYGIKVPQSEGGQGADSLAYVIMLEELCRVSAVASLYANSPNSLGGGPLLLSGTPEQKAKYLRPTVTGEKMMAFALTEPGAGSDAAGCKTVAVQDGDEWVINGSKCFNTNGPVADFTVIYALTDPALGTKGMAAFVVEKGTPGFTVGRVENKMGIRQAQVSEMHLENVRVPAEQMIAKPGEGFKLAMKTLDGGRIGVAAQGLGIAKGAFEATVAYMKQREQFGKPICKNQFLAFKMAELATQIKSAELLLYNAVAAHDSGRYTIEAAMAKLACTDAAMEMTTWATQFMGGNGFMKEYHVERMMRDAKITQIYEGTNEIQKLIISGSLFR